MSIGALLVPTLRVTEVQVASVPVADSRDLFRGGRQLLIMHAGQVYILRQTKDNKLILTK